MSTRQNKKQRKGRNNAHNRERTVTTLTEDPNTHYLVPTPSEEPAGSHMPPAFGGGKMHSNVSMGPPQFPNNYGGFGFNTPYPPVPNMHQQRQHQQAFFSSPPQHPQQQPHHQPQQQQEQMQMPDIQPKVPLPPGKNDLEILQNLKRIIKDNQHPFFKAIPDPVALAKLYKGKLSSQSGQASHGSQQVPSGSRTESGDASTSQPQSSTSGLGQSTGGDGRRQKPLPAGKDRRSLPSGGNQGNNSGRYNNPPSGITVSNLNLQNLKISQTDVPPPSGGAQSEPRSSEMASSGPNQSASDRRGYDYSGHYHKSDSSSGGRPYDSGYDNMATDGSMPSRGYMYSGKDDGYRPRGWGPRDYPPDDRDFDPERNMTPRPQGGSGNVDARQPSGPDRAGPPGDAYDRDRSRRDWNDRDRHRRLDNDRRDPRGTDTRRPSSIADQRPLEADFRQAPVRRGTAEPPVPPDAPQVSENPPAVDRPPLDARVETRAPPTRATDRLGLETEEVRSSRASSVRPMDAAPALASVPPTTAGDDVADDSSRRLSLKELRLRMNPPARSSRTPTDHSGEQSSSAYNQDRNKPPRSQQKDHGGPQSDRGPGRPTSPSGGPPPPMSGDRGYGRPPSPSGGPPPMSGGPPPPSRSFQPRSPSIEGRSTKGGPPPRGGGPRDFRGPGRSMSRDRGPGYRPDYHDSRYPPSGMDIDGPAPRYEGRPYRDFSPPPPGGRGPPPGEGPPGRDYPYPPGRRDWGPDEDDYYKHPRNWDGLPHERSRYERDYGAPPRSGGWSDREYAPRDVYPPGPPGDPLDDRYPPGPPVRDGRPPPAGYSNAPFNSRVRPRSPSPVRRPGPGSADDSRPPMKRSREDFPADYYPPGSRDGMRRPPPGEYPPPPRPGSPGPSNSGWAPTSGSSAGGSLAGSIPPAAERDYRMGRDMDYPPPGGYDRRSPGPPGPPGGRAPYNRGGAGGGSGGGAYGRGGGEPRDRGGYGMQRP